MKLDNFELFEKYILDFNSVPGNPFIYHIELIERKKDGVKTSGANNSSRRIASYFPESLDQWNKLKPRIIELADSRPGVRVYINPNRKRGDKVLKQLLLDVADRQFHDAFTGMSKIYDSTVAKTKPLREDVIWIIDLDSDDEFWDRRFEIEEYLKSNLITKLPSKSGEHLLVKPFNQLEFQKWFSSNFGCWKKDIIKHNALTNLYFNDKKD